MKRINYNDPSFIQALTIRYENILKKNPRSKIFAILADNYRKQGKINEAIYLCQEGLKYNSNFSIGYFVLARCYFEQKEYDKALRELKISEKFNPSHLGVITYIAKTYLLLGEFQEAYKYFKKLKLLSSSENKKLDELLLKLEDKINYLYKDNTQNDRPTLAILSKRPLFLDELEYYQVRNVKNIFDIEKISKNINREDFNKAQIKNLKNLYLSQGFTDKAKSVDALVDKSKIKEEQQTKKQYYPFNRDEILERFKKLQTLSQDIINVSSNAKKTSLDKEHILLEFIPKNILEKDKFDSSVIKEDLSSSSNVIFEKDYENMDVEKIKTIDNNKKTIKYNIEKLTSLLHRIQERAF